MDRKTELYRKIPRVDSVLEDEEIRTLTEKYGREAVLYAVRKELDGLRERIGSASPEEADDCERKAAEITDSVKDSVRKMFAPNVKRVINGTGTILHTNLGRAPLPRGVAEHLAQIVTGYSNLEYDLENGTRGERYSHVERLITRLAGSESAMVVNNNAAAVLLTIGTLAGDGEVVVSRGELVEIGGRFRIPDVVEAGGARLKEVGTTNKTHPEDYREALSDSTKAILKVHTSNFRIHGFTESVDAGVLKQIAEERGVPLIEDLGSGVLYDLEKLGLGHEPTVREAAASGADVICFSGDKLLGGPQAGIIIGRREYLDRIRKNPLARAVRVDKFTVTALELVLLEYLNPETVAERIPVLRMLGETPEVSRERAERLLARMKTCVRHADLALCETDSCVGGGALPDERITGTAVVIRPERISAARLSELMLQMPVPVIGRVQDNAVRLDVRTIMDEDFSLIAEMFGEVTG